MMEYLYSPVGQAIIWLSVVAILSLAGWYFVTGWRDRNNDVSTDVDVLSNFQKMRQQGVLDEDEFRAIKTNLGGRSARPEKEERGEEQES